MGSCYSFPPDATANDQLQTNNAPSDKVAPSVCHNLEHHLATHSELSLSSLLSDIPPWFPPENAHKDIRQLLKIKESIRIGGGNHASVFTAEYNGKVCVVKQIDSVSELGRTQFVTEARALSKLRHPAIIKYIDMLMDGKYYYLIVEKAGKDLLCHLNQTKYLCEIKIKKIIYALLGAVAYMHHRNVVHRDIKLDNIVFMNDNINLPQIIDFGDAEMAVPDKIYTEFVGTPNYMSPERLQQHNCHELKESDIWAIGCVAFEMFCGEKCFQGPTQREVFGKILRGDWSWKLEENPSEDMRDFVGQCLNMDVKKRLSAKAALGHRWFADIKKEMDIIIKMKENIFCEM